MTCRVVEKSGPCVMSPTWPAATIKRRGSASASIWTLSSAYLWNAPAPDPLPHFRSPPVDGAHDSAVDHLSSDCPVSSKGIKGPLPYSGMAPATEPAVDRLPLAIALPAGSCEGAPERRIHKHPITKDRLSIPTPVRPGWLALSGNKGENHLRLDQLPSKASVLHTVPSESAIHRFGNPVCRLVLSPRANKKAGRASPFRPLS